MTPETVHDSLPELTYTEEDIELPQVIGRIAGPTKNRPDGVLINGNGTSLYLYEPRRTQYVLILHFGDLAVSPYDEHIHGQWNDIPPIQGSISEFISAIEGVGENEITLGEQYRKVRHTTSAMHTFDDTEKKVRKNGGDPSYHIDKSEGLFIHEQKGYIIPFPAESFALDHSRRTIRRIRKPEAA